jgi:phosphoglucomutase
MVQFGTSGWRGIIGRELTFRTVRIVAQAIVDVLREDETPLDRVVIGYDTRMLSEKFARAATELIASNGVSVELAERDIPSPVLACAVIDRQAAAGLIFTGSHNPPEYNGLKVYTNEGILAPSTFTDRIEDRCRQLTEAWDDTFLPRSELIGSHNPKAAYLDRLQGLIDWDAIRGSGIEIVVDPLFGTTREYLDHILLENEVPVTVIHNTRDPYFGGYAPDCTSENLSRLRDTMRRSGAQLGLATDGDGDRFGILDQGARMLDSCQALALILDYLARRRGLSGAVGRTLATSKLLTARVGTFAFRRTQISLSDRTRQILERRIKRDWKRLNGRKVIKIDRRDGLKLIFEGGSWILIRVSGTEPKIRLYAEGRSSEEQRHLMHAVRQLFTNRRL